MLIEFYKYQGTGNDFVMIDNRSQKLNLKQKQIKHLCNRNFGIGADGLILLENHEGFRMVYFNSDGRESTMCGNGGRCIAQFIYDLKLTDGSVEFHAIDGKHQARINLNSNSIALEMQNVTEVKKQNQAFFLDTGSPHHVQFELEVDQIDVREKGEQIRYGLYGKEGANVNFVEVFNESKIKVRTYERGVENETLSCGTGVTASAIAAHKSGNIKKNRIEVETLGGDLRVEFEKDNESYKNIYLIGNAKQVFHGAIEI